ncbi:hypothetical protein TSUD_48930 [Trifolium subterraneum]|uniref:Uncharacterized protein n=1 Tax=Trifolium subterraneum TaxID=3900 RepID=A0A2Z6LX19_TRISU|nr:hypothetical protein TSUD_48930 [Trifolium subterraneum]
MFLDLQFARKESRSIDAALLEEQVNQMLLEWRAGLNEPSSAASLKLRTILLNEGSHGSFSTDICRLFQLCEHEDDATSLLAVPRHEPNDQTMQTDAMVIFQEENTKDRDHPHISTYLPSLCPPPVFLGPKCALWDSGIAPVLCPGGIGLKDNLLLASLSAKAEGKDVGILECEGAATAKSPWNAPEFFDLFVLEGETIREWLSLISLEGHLRVETESKELKRVDGKKSSKAKITSDSVTNLQKRIGRLSAEFPYDSRRSAKGRAKPDAKADIGDQFINARIMSGDLKVGVEVSKNEDGLFTREAVCNAVRVVMDTESELGQTVRTNHAKWREFLLSQGLENSYVDDLVQKLDSLLKS